ncbi:GNAT family N-acetyltransferase [Oceanirhabdus sp. W0125-5]|uniref:GNAT family N-acetyltransferase n=1 Tax=Oceanirhabdus sp. W0125-5 TaxID=2999116 RepID=UPI0022F2BA9F|nr:GNAT family N-acetyltransferase [Oceanirhabdus sp. W0125-5]WBW94995.1 GNAT family N-acetyltransferase [Oceanirhabdus sp. W0125-5]
MLTPFVKEDNFFNEKPFLNDEVQFNLMHRIADDSNALLLRAEDNRAIAARSTSKHPMWLWTEPKLSTTEVQDVIKEVNMLLANEESFELVATHEIIELFSKEFGGHSEEVMEMESYHCPEVLMPDSISGVMKKSSMEDVEIIAEYCKGFIYWGFGKEVTRESQLKGAESLIKSGNLYVLKVNGSIVSMAYIAHRAPRHARINYVYTPPKHRKNGYASELVAYLSKVILDEGLTPNLYTDLSNSTSNKVYKSVGYIECGKVRHYRFSRTKAE